MVLAVKTLNMVFGSLGIIYQHPPVGVFNGGF